MPRPICAAACSGSRSASAVVIASWRMDRFESMGGSLYTAPGLVPGLFGCALLLLGAAAVLAVASTARSGLRPRRSSRCSNRRIVGTLLLTLLYAALLVGRLPFWLGDGAVRRRLHRAFHSDAATPLRRYGIAVLSPAS